jgi:septal ring factor EnvC (AmiA/AmiB activator)
MKGLRFILAALIAVGGLGAHAEASTTEQLDLVRSRIASLEDRISRLDAENRTRQEQREKLTAELELAEARVTEIEIVLERSDAEAEEIAASVVALGSELERHRGILAGHVEILALLGRPGTLQLLYDGSRGGDLEGAVSTVAVLTSGQLELVAEYQELHRQRSARLAELSRILSRAKDEAEILDERRLELEAVRSRVDDEINRLARSQNSAVSELEELRQREQALARLMDTLSDQSRFTGVENIRQFKGALPWPAAGPVVRGFGRKYLPKYSTYTVCNGLRFDSPSGSEVTAVFPGEVAYARFFKGYGNMVVIDHGQNVYSLVAGLATIHVRVKQRVDMGLRLGLASPPSDDGNTYFEMRVGKKPEDPTGWLQLRSD